MRKILSFLFVFLLLCSCQSREEKVAELIKQEMFKTLYDFESYEPIETKIDSAFTSISQILFLNDMGILPDLFFMMFRPILIKSKTIEILWKYGVIVIRP